MTLITHTCGHTTERQFKATDATATALARLAATQICPDCAKYKRTVYPNTERTVAPNTAPSMRPLKEIK